MLACLVHTFGLQVPLIIKAPWVPGSAGRVSNEPVELVDLYRTLADLANLPAPANTTGPTDHDAVQGRSLAPLLLARPDHGGKVLQADRYALSQITRCFSVFAASGTAEYYPCLSNAPPLPDTSRAYNFMGSVTASP